MGWNYAFSLSLGLSKTFRTHRPRYSRNISIELIWPAIFEAPCCNIIVFRARCWCFNWTVWRIWDRDYLLSTDCFTKDNPAVIVCENWIQIWKLQININFASLCLHFLWLDALKRTEKVIRENAFKQKKRKVGYNLAPVSANRPSNNSAKFIYRLCSAFKRKGLSTGT